MSVTRRMFGKTAGYATGFLPMVAKAMTPEVKKQVVSGGGYAGYYDHGYPSGRVQATDFDVLSDLFESDRWPQAVPPDMICSDEEAARKERAEQIIKFFVEEDLEGKSFLDYGCGYGDTLDVARKAKVRNATGYEPYPMRPTGEVDRGVFSFICGYYDVILMYDVLDHLHREAMFEALTLARKHLNRQGTIHLRCHPYTSSTGAHLYKQQNKAFAHLIFSDEELARLNLMPMPTIKTKKNPVLAYQEAIGRSGLKVRSMKAVVEPIPEFFLTHPLVKERFLAHWGGNEHAMMCEAHIQFVDFQLVA